jgi:molybdate transport system substrate-binding protein
MKHVTLPATLFATWTLAIAANLAGAAEIRVLTPGGASPGVRLLATEFTKASGTQVTVTSTQPMIVRQRVLAGETFDVIVQSQPALDETGKAGLLRPGSRLGLARGGIGVIVREGAPSPDVSTAEGFKRALLAAPKVVINNPTQPNGAGPMAISILTTVGILDAVQRKWRVEDIGPGSEVIARGEADIGLFNLTAVPYSVGVKLAGPVPPPLQLYTSYDAAVMAKAAAPEDALAFVKFMTSDAARNIWAATRFEMLPSKSP